MRISAAAQGSAKTLVLNAGEAEALFHGLGVALTTETGPGFTAPKVVDVIDPEYARPLLELRDALRRGMDAAEGINADRAPEGRELERRYLDLVLSRG